MPVPRSRRMARNTKSVPPPEADAAASEDIEVVDPAPFEDYAEQSIDAGAGPVEQVPAEESTTGSRRSRAAAGRSSRRAAASSARASSSNKRSSRREATPQERAARRASLLLVVKILLGVIAGGALAFGVWWLFMRVDPRVNVATQTLAEVDGLIRSIDNDITLKAAAEAETKRKQALELLDKSAELGFASATPDANDPKLAGPAYALRANAQKEQLIKGIKARVERVERDTRVVTNLRQVQSGFGLIQSLTDAELTNFEKDANNFMDNPVMPAAGRVEQYVNEYKSEISTVKTQLMRIDQEKTRRLAEITDLPVQQARGQSAVLVQQEKFQEALSLIDELQRTYEGANFTGVRQYVTDAAKQSWEAAAAMANENYTTYQAPGTTKDMAEASLKAARLRMEQVVERFGMDEYVSKAKAALERYRP